MKPLVFRTLLALALFVLAAAPAGAEPVSFAYSWHFTELPPWWNGGSSPSLYDLSPDGNSLTVRHGTGVAVLTLAPPGVASVEPGAFGVEIPFGSVAVVRPFAKVQNNGGFTLAFTPVLRIVDPESGWTAYVRTFRHVSVSYAGDVARPWTSGGADGWSSPGVIGGHQFAVGIPDVGVNYLDQGGSPLPLTARVGVDGGPIAAPEPAAFTLALAGGALSLWRVAARRRRTGSARPPSGGP